MSEAQRIELKEKIGKICLLNEKRRQDAALAAREKAQEIWEKAVESSGDHPYLKRKKITAAGLRRLGDRLLVPMRDRGGRLMNCQSITAGGTKRFMKDALVKGLFCLLGRPSGVIYIVESYATMASVYMATGEACTAAFNAGNLLAACRQIRESYSVEEVVV